MANANVPTGLSPVRGAYSQVFNGSANQYSVPSGDATAIFVGDPVKLVGTSSTINGQVFADVAKAATADVIVGVVIAVLPDTRDSLVYRAASSARILIV